MTLNEDQLQEIDEAFELFADENSLNYQQLLRAMRALGFDLNQESLNQLFIFHNITPSQVSSQQFILLMSKLIEERGMKEERMKAFKYMDRNNSGKLNIQKLRTIAAEIGQVVSEDELKKMIEQFDVDADGQISLQEFLSIFDT